MEVYRQSDEYEVVGLADPDPDRLAKVSGQAAYRDVPTMTVEQLLEIPGLQAVAIETEPKDLLKHAELCVDRRLHIHLDKPAGESLLQFRRILDAAASHHTLIQMGYMFRYNPAVLFLKNALQQGWLGDPFELHTVMSKVVSPSERRRLAAYPGGMMFELGCHLIDTVITLLGPPDKVTPYRQHASSIDDGLIDNQLAVLEYPRCLASVKSAAMEVDGGARRHLVVCGSEGTLHIEPLDSPQIRLVLSRPRSKYGKGTQTVTFPQYKRYVGDAQEFAKCIRDHQPLNWSYEHDYTVQKIVLQASGCATDR